MYYQREIKEHQASNYGEWIIAYCLLAQSLYLRYDRLKHNMLGGYGWNQDIQS